MTYGQIFEKAASIIGREHIEDYRPAVYEGRLNGMFDFPKPTVIPDAIIIWLKNGDRVVYRVADEKGEAYNAGG